MQSKPTSAIPAGQSHLEEYSRQSFDPNYFSVQESSYDNPEVLVEITSKCNFACDYCSSSFKERSKGNMSIELFEHIARQLPDITNKPIRLHIDGEPTAHPKFYELAKIVNNYGMRIALATNGSIMDPKWLDLKMNMLISISTNPEELRVRHRGLDFDAYVDNIIKYLRHWNQVTTDQIIKFQVMYYLSPSNNKYKDYTAKKLFFIAGLIKEAGLDIFYSDKCEMDFDKFGQYTLTKSLNEIIIFCKHNVAKSGLYPENGVRNEYVPTETGFCDSSWKRLAILYDGTVSYCCIDLSGRTAYTEPKDIWESKLKDIWMNHPTITKVRNNFTKGKITHEVCKTCLAPCVNNQRFISTSFPCDFQS